jgi:hypothetical protein
MFFMRSYMKKTQSVTEYALFISAVLVGFLAMQVYYHRAVKGNLKAKTDMIGEQFNLKDANYTLETKSVSVRDNYQGSGRDYTDAYGNQKTATMTSTISSSPDSGFMDDITAAGGNLSASYAGGEISTSDYVNDTGHGIADMGNISSNDTIPQDMGM